MTSFPRRAPGIPGGPRRPRPPFPGPGPIPPTPGPTPGPGPEPGATFTLTTNIETLPAAGQTAAPNAVFNAPAASNIIGTVLNTLQTGDVLNGGGAGNVLNATFAGAAGTAVPTINNIGTVNITALTAGQILNAALASGVTTIGDVNSVANVVVTGLNTPLTTLNKTGGIQRTTAIEASANALTGLANSIQVNLSGQTGTGDIDLTPVGQSATNGYETINVASTGTNSVGRLTGGLSVDNIVATGGSLTIARDEVAPIDNTVLSFNGSALTGALNLGSVGTTQSVVEADVNFSFIGSNNLTNLVIESGSLTTGDNLVGGSGLADTLTLTGDSAGGATAGTSGAFNAAGFEILRVAEVTGVGVAATNTYDLTNVRGVNRFVVNSAATGANDVQTFSNVVYAGPVAVSAVGTGAAGAQTTNGVNLGFTPLSVFGVNDTLNYTFNNQGVAVGTGNTVTSAALTFNGIENLNLAFADLSNDSSSTATNGSTVAGLSVTANSARAVSIISASGSQKNASAINLSGGAIGSAVGSVSSVLVDSNAGVTAAFNQANGASFLVTGSGFSNITSNTGLTNVVAINATTATGNLQLGGGGGADLIIGGAGNDAINGRGSGDSIDFSVGGTDTAVLSALTDTLNSATAFSSPVSATVSTIDNITGAGNGDRIDLSALDVSASSVGTSFTAVTADALNLVRGTFNGTTFTTSGSGDDYFLQIVESASSGSNSGILLLDITGTVTATVASEIVTLSVV